HLALHSFPTRRSSDLAGCSGYQKLLQSNDIEKKYQAAVKYYEKEDFFRASELLDQVTPLLTGSDKAETALFYQANSHYEQGSYIDRKSTRLNSSHVKI